jgi:predicted phage replisome organizer
MGEKRYYWLKFKDDFFDSKRIKKLRKMAGGDTYVIIYLKMQLKALRTDGVLEYTGIEPDFVDELALDLDEAPDDVRMTLAYLMTYGLCECSDNIHYFLPYVVENTGSETASTQRVRDYRERQKALQCNADVTQVKRICNAEKEIEIEKREKSKSIRTFVPPTLEEVKAYASENHLNVDAERFYRYFTTPNDKGETWVDSKGNKVKNWKQKMLTWDRADSTVNVSQERAKSRNTMLNYAEKGVSHPRLEDIEMDIDDL